jgi:hypothetical protein
MDRTSNLNGQGLYAAAMTARAGFDGVKTLNDCADAKKA